MAVNGVGAFNALMVNLPMILILYAYFSKIGNSMYMYVNLDYHETALADWTHQIKKK